LYPNFFENRRNMQGKDKIQSKVEIKNKRAGFEFELLDKYSAGIVLSGTEIKSIRRSKVNIQDAYCVFKGIELYIINMQISSYEEGSYNNVPTRRDRKLLLKRQELKKLLNKSLDVGLTIVPTRLFISDKGFAKVDIALAKGKKLHDKRHDIKEKDVKREMAREKY